MNADVRARPDAASAIARLVSDLGRPEACAGVVDPPPARVDVVQTHVSVLFFAGERVFKLKKPVDLGFFEALTLPRRRWLCEEELRLNRRLAPSVYLGLRAVVAGPDGRLRFAADDAAPDGADVEDWAVEMARLPADRMLDALLERGEVDNALMDALAELLVDFHRDAATGAGVDEHAGPDAVCRQATQTLERLRRFVGDDHRAAPAGLALLTPRLHRHLELSSADFLRDNARFMGRRVRQGRAREGHGDLHAGNICWTDERPLVYDALEFSRELRCADVARDLAFLAMDLDARGFRGFARYLVRRYAQLAGDPDLRGLMAHHKADRALVRALVEGMTAVDGSVAYDAREAARWRAQVYANLAASYALPPALLITCGLPGTGKTTVARGVARPFEALVLRSDVRRKTLAGRPPGESAAAPWGEGLYSPGSVDRTYQVLLDEAITSLEHGRTVVVDATFAARRHRRRFLDAALRLDHPVGVIHVTCDEDLVRERLSRRAREGGGASDADWEVHERARAAFEPPTEVHPTLMIEATSDDRPEEVAARVLDRLAHQSEP